MAEEPCKSLFDSLSNQKSFDQIGPRFNPMFSRLKYYEIPFYREEGYPKKKWNDTGNTSFSTYMGLFTILLSKHFGQIRQ